jgi:polar amino acid transport system substrate-binding protein
MENVKNSKIVGLIVALGLIFVCCAAFTSCGEASTENGSSSAEVRTLDQIKQSGEIKIGVFTDKSPFGYLDENGNNVGYDIELGNKIAADLGVKVKYIPTDAAARVSSVQSGKTDVILANFTKTDERAEQVDFQLPYMQVALGMVSKTEDPINSLEDLQNDTSKQLIVVKGTTAETYLEKNYPDLLDRALKFEQYSEVQNALTDGRGAAWLTDNTEALAFANQTSGFTVPEKAATIGEKDIIAPATAKGNTALEDFINQEVKDLTDTDFFKNAYSKYLAPLYGDQFESEIVLTSDELKKYE